MELQILNVIIGLKVCYFSEGVILLYRGVGVLLYRGGVLLYRGYIWYATSDRMIYIGYFIEEVFYLIEVAC